MKRPAVHAPVVPFGDDPSVGDWGDTTSTPTSTPTLEVEHRRGRRRGGQPPDSPAGSESRAGDADQYVRGSDWGGGVGGVLYSMRGGSPLYSHANARGDIIARSDTNGALTWQAAYEAFDSHPAEPRRLAGDEIDCSGHRNSPEGGDAGRRRSHQTGTNPDRQRANSKDEDPTGLINDGFRYRDPLTGTFLTRDPIGFEDGPNLYTED